MWLFVAWAGCPFAPGSASDACPEDGTSLLQLRAQNAAALHGGTCPSVATTTPTCSAELQAWRELASTMGNASMAKTGPQFVRMVFHDAIDFNNLVSSSGETPSGGGVDACLYSTVTPDGSPDHSHNRNLPAQVLTSLQSRLGCTMSQPDVEVFAAVVAVEEAGGPRVPMRYGRAKGRCDRLVDCEFKGNGCASDYTIKVSPPAKSFAADDFREAFAHLGFSAEEQVALMGAHTYGKLQVCAGGFNGIEHGNFCKDGERCAKNGDFELGAVLKKASPFGDGGVFDMTPQVFDNNYFALMQDEPADGDQQCCGKTKWWGKLACHRRGKAARLDGKPSKDLCEVGFCRSDRKGRSHMKSTRYFVEPEPSFVKAKHGTVKRVIRLGGDWALLKRSDTLEHVRRFAQDQPRFFDAFRRAFSKLAVMGAGDLESCRPDACEKQARGLTCGTLEFFFDALACPAEAADGCALVGGSRSKGMLDCGGRRLECCVGAPCAE